MPELAVKDDARIARPLNVLIPLIRKEIELGDAAGKEHYAKAGAYLIEAKTQLEDDDTLGEDTFKEWIDENFHLSESTAYRYMKYAETDPRLRRRSRTLSEVVEPNRQHHQPPWHEPIRMAVKTLNVERLTAEMQNKEREAKLIRELGLRLIDIGYKVLAQQLHPDKGGSRDGMARLNRVRDLLKGAL